MNPLLSRLRSHPALQPLIRKPWFWVAVGLPLAYGLFGFFGVPYLIKHYAPQAVSQLIQRPLTLGKVAFNPFLFRLDVRDAVLTETDHQPVFALKRLHVDFELIRTLMNRTPTFAELRLEGPTVNLIQDKDGVLNMARIAASLPPEDPVREKPPEDDPPPGLIVQKIILAEGEVSFENQSQEPPIVNRADHLDLELNNISTLPGRHGLYEIDAALPEGGTLRWEGDVSLNPVKSTGTLNVEGLKVLTLWHFVQDRLALSEPAGDIGLSARYDFSHDKTNTLVKVEDAVFTLAGLKLTTAEAAVPLADLETFRIAQTRIDLAAQSVDIPTIELRKGKINLAIDPSGILNWQTLAKPVPAPATPAPSTMTSPDPSTPTEPWTVKLGQLNLDELAIDFADARPGVEARGGIGNIGLTLRAEASAGGTAEPVVHVGDLALRLQQIQLNQAKTPLLALDELRLEELSLDLPTQTLRAPRLLLGKGHVSAQLDETGRLNWLSLLPPQPTTNEPKAAPAAAEAANAAPTKPWHLAVDQFKLGELALDVTDDSHKAPLKASLGALSLGFKVDAVAGSDAPQAIISNIDASLDRLAVIETQTETSLLKWDSLKLEQGQVDVAKQAASIRRLVLKGGGTAVAREANGAIYPVSLFESDSSPQPQIPATPKKLGAVKSTTAEKSWLFNLGEMAIHDFGLGVKDKSPVGTLAYNLDAINASVKNVSNAGKTPLNFKLGTTIRQGGALSLAGTAAPTGEHAKTQITLDRFSLVQLQPYLSEFAALKLQSANLSTHLAVDFQQATPTPKIRVTGDANLANLDLPQSRDGKKFLAWGDLNTHGIDFSLTPDKLTIKELKLVEPDSVIAIHQDKSSNISDIIRPRKAAAPPSAQASHGSGKSQPAFPVSIGRIVVEKGKVDFSDASLVLPFATRVHDFGGSIAGFALTPQSRMTLQLAGKVDEFGETRVDGSLSPLDIKQFSDINVIFRNVTMSSLSPYSATFAGRRIESGKLDLDLQYRIENHQLKSQNKITLEQFRLGEQVESPNATSLPLDLAIALLTDAEGKIQASVPVEGTLDDPKFAYGTVVWDAFTTLIKNAATAPFKALVSLVGSGDGDPGTVAFDAGRSEIPPPEREKLQKLAASLASKGQLKLTIHGGIDAKADAAALKVLAVRRLVANQLDIELKPGEMPDPVNIADAASQRVLEKLAAESGAADSVAAAYAREKGRPPERMGAMSGLLGRPSQTPDFYEQLLASLEEKTELPAGQLQALAEQRAKAVMSELLERQRFDRQRAVIGPVEDAQETADRRVAIRLDLGV